jgi:hypothetical protein
MARRAVLAWNRDASSLDAVGAVGRSIVDDRSDRPAGLLSLVNGHPCSTETPRRFALACYSSLLVRGHAGRETDDDHTHLQENINSSGVLGY